jgi:hypothetical protein
MSNELTKTLWPIADSYIKKLKEQFKNDRTRVKTGGVDDWDKNTRFTPKQ